MTSSTPLPEQALREKIKTIFDNLYIWDNSAAGAVKIEESLENAQQELATLILQDRKAWGEQVEIDLLRDTAKGFEVVLEPEFEKGGRAAIEALRKMADYKETERQRNQGGKTDDKS